MVSRANPHSSVYIELTHLKMHMQVFHTIHYKKETGQLQPCPKQGIDIPVYGGHRYIGLAWFGYAC